MKKIFATLFAVLFIMTGTAMAGSYGCIGSDCGNVTGSLDISALSLGGGIDADIQGGHHGLAGGISAAGGLSAGQAEGTIKTFTYNTYGYYGGEPGGPGYYKKIHGQNAGEVKYFKNGHPENQSEWTFLGSDKGWYKKTIAGGTVEASLNTIGGGYTKTEAYTFHENGLKGVGSSSDSYAITGADLDVRAFGVAAVEGCVFGVAGQGSLDGSVVFNHGVSAGYAGQYSVGYFAGAAGVVGFGSAGVDAQVEMNGQSYSESYSGKFVKDGVTTRVLGTNVGAATEVSSFGNTYDCGLAESYLTGGWQAGGAVAAKTVMFSDGGFAKAEANGSYSGAGPLGCNFEGSAVGGTQTTATTVNGYNGSVMTSSATMKVSAKTGSGSIAK